MSSRILLPDPVITGIHTKEKFDAICQKSGVTLDFGGKY